MPPPGRRRSPLILVVDDDRDTRELYRACFDVSGYCTAEAANGEAALEAAHRLLPELILTDLMLPDIDGLAVTARLKRDARTSGVRVIVLTGYIGDDLEKMAADAGAELALLKPCLPEAMLREVQRALKRDATTQPDVRGSRS